MVSQPADVLTRRAHILLWACFKFCWPIHLYQKLQNKVVTIDDFSLEILRLRMCLTQYRGLNKPKPDLLRIYESSLAALHVAKWTVDAVAIMCLI